MQILDERLISVDIFTLHELECEQTRYNLQITTLIKFAGDS